MTSHLSHASTSRTAGQPSAGNGGHPAAAALMTRASLDELHAELEELRARTRIDLAQRLRDASAFGAGSNNDEFHAIREEQIVLEARIAALEDTIARAAVAEPDDLDDGVATIGSTVLIEDLDSGAARRYRLVSAHRALGPDAISAASPMGQALVGAAAGSVVTFDLPNGASRSVRLARVTPERSSEAASQAAA
jgi:transcription elongation factor GreA